MSSYPATRGTNNAASSPSGGGCLSVLFFPPVAVLLVGAFFVLGMGQTTLVVDASAGSAGSQENAEIEEKSEEQNAPNVLARLFTPQVLFWENKILAWAQEWRLDPNLVATVMQIESCGDPQAVSGSGAMGLFQVMPYHFVSGENPYAPDTNAYRGMAYLRRALEAHSTARLALAGYNGGITTAGQPESYWPDETIRYAYWGENIYADAVEGKKQSATLDEWLASGGASLCAQAGARLGLAP